LNKDGRLHVVPACVNGDYIIRFTVTSFYTTEDDINRDWKIIQEVSTDVLKHFEKEENIEFQSSLILSHVPKTPKFVNASFAAFFADADLTYDFNQGLANDYSNTLIPLTPRKTKNFLGSCTKGISLDNITPNLRMIRLLGKNNQAILLEDDDDDLIAKDNQNQQQQQSQQDENNDQNNLENDTLKTSPVLIPKYQKNINKQCSLDSKIQHIFETKSDDSNNNNINHTTSFFNSINSNIATATTTKTVDTAETAEKTITEPK
jgi:hypothetical protein